MTPIPPGWLAYLAAVRRHRRVLAGAFALGLALPLASLPVLWLLHRAIDVSLPRGDVGGLLLAIAAIVAIRLAVLGLAFAFTGMAARGVRTVTRDLRDTAMARLQRLQWSDLSALDEADVQGRLTTDSSRIEEMTHALFHSVLPVVVPTVAIYGAVLFLISWQLTLAMAVAAVLLRVLVWRSTLRLRRSIALFQQGYAGFQIATFRAIGMLRVDRMQGTERAARAEFDRHTRDLAAVGAGMGAAGSLNAQVNTFCATAAAVMLLGLGGVAITRGQFSPGVFAAFFVAAAQVNGSLSAFIGNLPLLLAGHESLARFAVLSTMGREEDRLGLSPPDFTQPLVFAGVSFAHAHRPILQGAQLCAEPGRTTAIFAANGEGKSTLLALAAGLIAPEGGRIALGAETLDRLDLDRFRAGLGMLPQAPAFLNASLRDNIAYGRPDADPHAIAAAAYLAGLDPVLDRLPAGLDSPMGERGGLLSGGERQRVALARALVHAPALLLLDEPSNHLDDAAVALLIERLLDAPGRPTILMATHDPRLLAAADEVYDLVAGLAVARAPLRLVRR